MKKLLIAVLSLVMTIGVGAGAAFAADGTIFFDGADSGVMGASHDVTVNGESKTIYCLQEKYVWPQSDTPYYKPANETEKFLDSEQIEVLRRLMYAGYPHNVEGIFDYLYEDEEWAEYADEYAAECTQYAIWAMMGKWNKEGNYPYDEDRASIPEVEALINFAENGGNIDPPDNPEITIIGDSIMTQGDDGVYRTELKITEPKDFNISYNVKAADSNVRLVDADGYEISKVRENEAFYVEADNISDVINGVGITATADISYPTDVEYYATDAKFEGREYQTMLCVGIEDATLTGEINVKAEPAGSLTVRKEMHDDASAEEAGNSDFNFIITLEGQGKNEYSAVKRTADEKATETKVESNDKGVIKVDLKADEEIEIRDIPEEIEYTVKENTDNTKWEPAYKVNGEAADAAEGTIADETFVTVTNDYSYEPVSADMTAVKILNGARIGNYDGRFDFVLFPEAEEHSNPMPSDSKPNPDNGRMEKASSNDANGGIDFGTIKFDHPGVYHYIIEEKDSNLANITSDSSYYLVTVNVKSKDGELTSDVTYEKNGESKVNVPSFENEYNSKVIFKHFRATKEVTNNSSDERVSPEGYVFELTPVGGEVDTALYPEFKEGEKNCTLTSDKNGEAVSTELKISEDWVINTLETLKGELEPGKEYTIPLKYEMKEVNGQVPGITYSDTTVTVTETVYATVNEMHGVDSLRTETSYGSTGSEEPEFINEYNAEADYSLQVKKNFKPADYVPADGETYEFKVDDSADNGDGYKLDSNNITLSYDGGSFIQKGGDITFSKAGRYVFVITEKNKDLKTGMLCDENKWEVIINVTDNGDGTLAAEAVYESENKPADHTGNEAVFTNEYKPTVAAAFSFTKNLNDRDWYSHDEFHFAADVAYDEDNSDRFDPTADGQSTGDAEWTKHITVGQTQGNSSEGEVNAVFAKKGAYYVVLGEVAGNDASIVYDKNVYVAKYVVSKPGNDLEVSDPEFYVCPDGNWNKKEKANAVVFDNYATVLEISKKVVDTAGRASGDESFDIRLTIDGSDEAKNGTYKAVIAGEHHFIHFTDGEYVFTLKAGETAHIEGLPAGTKYSVEELMTAGQKKIFDDTYYVYDGSDKQLDTDNGSSIKSELKDDAVSQKVCVENTVKESAPGPDDKDKDKDKDKDEAKDKNHGGVDTSDHAPLKPMIFLSITSLLGIIFMLFRRRIAK